MKKSFLLSFFSHLMPNVLALVLQTVIPRPIFPATNFHFSCSYSVRALLNLSSCLIRLNTQQRRKTSACVQCLAFAFLSAYRRLRRAIGTPGKNCAASLHVRYVSDGRSGGMPTYIQAMCEVSMSETRSLSSASASSGRRWWIFRRRGERISCERGAFLDLAGAEKEFEGDEGKGVCSSSGLICSP